MKFFITLFLLFAGSALAMPATGDVTDAAVSCRRQCEDAHDNCIRGGGRDRECDRSYRKYSRNLKPRLLLLAYLPTDTHLKAIASEAVVISKGDCHRNRHSNRGYGEI